MRRKEASPSANRASFAGELADPPANIVVAYRGKMGCERRQHLQTYFVEAVPAPRRVNTSRRRVALAHAVERLNETVKACAIGALPRSVIKCRANKQRESERITAGGRISPDTKRDPSSSMTWRRSSNVEARAPMSAAQAHRKRWDGSWHIEK